MSTETETDSLVNLLQGTLDRVIAVYAQAGVSLPERRYWTLTSAPVDCEQAVVLFLQAYVGPPGDEAATPQRCDGPRTAVLQVQISRQIPTVSAKGKAPLPDQIMEYATPLAQDAYVLLDCATSLEQWDETAGYGLGVIATVESGEPQGGFQTVILNISMAIP